APGDQATTFGGGLLAMAAIVSTYRIIEEEGLVDRVAKRSEELRGRLLELPRVREVRGLGYLLGIETDRPAKDVQAAFLEDRILVGTSSEPSTMRLLPPLTVADDEWEIFLAAARR